MTNIIPAGGLPIRIVLHTLATGPTAEMLQLYYQHEAEPQEVLRSLVQALWSAVLLAEMEGRVRITGILPGEMRSEILERGLLLTSTADFRGNTLSTAVGTVNGVLVHQVQPVPPQYHTQIVPAAAGISADTVARAAAWMGKNVTSTSKRADSIEQCRQAVSVTDRVARDAWNALPQGLKRSRGSRDLKSDK